MNPDKCQYCKQLCDPFDPEYCIWNGQRWHVSCAVKKINDDIETMQEKQKRYDTTAANYSALQAKIEDALDQREGLMKILHEVPEQSQELGKLFMRTGENLVRRDPQGRLVDGVDSRELFGLPGVQRQLRGATDEEESI